MELFFFQDFFDRTSDEDADANSESNDLYDNSETF